MFFKLNNDVEIESKNSIGINIDSTKRNVGILALAIGLGLSSGSALSFENSGTKEIHGFSVVELNKHIETTVRDALPQSYKNRLKELVVTQESAGEGHYYPAFTQINDKPGTCKISLHGMNSIEKLAFQNAEHFDEESRKLFRYMMSVHESMHCLNSIQKSDDPGLKNSITKAEIIGVKSEDQIERNTIQYERADEISADIYAFSQLAKNLLLNAKTPDEKIAGLKSLSKAEEVMRHVRVNWQKAEIPDWDINDIHSYNTYEAVQTSINHLRNILNQKNGEEKLRELIGTNEKAFEFANKSAAGYILNNYAELQKKFIKFSIDHNFQTLEDLKKDIPYIDFEGGDGKRNLKTFETAMTRAHENIQYFHSQMSASQEAQHKGNSLLQNQFINDAKNLWKEMGQVKVDVSNNYKASDTFLKNLTQITFDGKKINGLKPN